MSFLDQKKLLEDEYVFLYRNYEKKLKENEVLKELLRKITEERNIILENLHP